METEVGTVWPRAREPGPWEPSPPEPLEAAGSANSRVSPRPPTLALDP